MANVIQTAGLTKHYKDVVAVDAVDFAVPQGRILGLLGPNGAGKTTIIGMLLGLIRPTAGTIQLFGKPANGFTDQAVRRIGAIMETPAFYPYLSGRDNLKYFQGLSGRRDEAELDRLLDLVNLSGRAHAKFSTYSLGMKHRLGIAYSLLGDPELLLLDEPTNGLDPAGMAEVRALIKSLGAGERTIVLASHLLNEVEQVCDSVAILSKGTLIAQGPVADLIRGRGTVRLRTSDDAGAAEVLEALDWTRDVVVAEGGLVVTAPADRTVEISRALAARGIFIAEMVGQETSLEQYFLEVTGDGESL